MQLPERLQRPAVSVPQGGPAMQWALQLPGVHQLSSGGERYRDRRRRRRWSGNQTGRLCGLLTVLNYIMLATHYMHAHAELWHRRIST